MKGIGPVIAANMITSTHNFTRFANWQKFACYIGTAPLNIRLVQALEVKVRLAIWLISGLKSCFI